MKREFLQGLMTGEQSLPKDVIDAIMAENGRDIQAAKQSAALWEEKYNQAVQTHQAQLEQLRFEQVFTDALRSAGGRNAKAIAALLDMEDLKAQPDPGSAVAAALEALKGECAYLFEAQQLPPPYARGTGTRHREPEQPASLAEALRQRMK